MKTGAEIRGIIRGKTRKLSALISVILISAFFSAVSAEEFTSSSFKVLEPVLQPAGYSTSSGYSLIGTISQIAIGTSTASSFNLSGGFLYYPFASSPVVTATAGDGQVSLSWTASQGFLGWTVSGYNVGRSTAPGGPYTFSASLGNVTSSTRTGLTNGTTYYFVVRAEDAFVNNIATSSEVSSAPVAAPVSPTPTPTPSVGGGGGGGGLPPTLPHLTKVLIKGRAYPAASITIFKDGTTAATPKADQNGNFEAEIGANAGIYTFSIYAIDSENRRSLTTSFTTNIPSGQTVTISDIVLSPTIGADKSQVKFGNDIKFFGYAYPASQINVIINSEHGIADTAESDKFGFWDYVLDSGSLEKGDHTTKTQTVTQDSLISPFSESLAFRVGDSDTLFSKLPALRPAAPAACNKNGDINNDGRVNIIDFSIMLFFWNQRSPKNPCADINGDGIVNLFDFSIMLFWWTG